MIKSEREVADVLDALRVPWIYEPTLFVFEASATGVPKRGFRPDFYLPIQDIYIEVTQAKDSNDKNRKIRKLRELYPEIQVELVAKPHFKELRARIEEILALYA